MQDFLNFLLAFLMFFIVFYYFPGHMLCSPSCGIRPVGKSDQTELEGIVRHSHVHNLQKLVPRRNCLWTSPGFTHQGSQTPGVRQHMHDVSGQDSSSWASTSGCDLYIVSQVGQMQHQDGSHPCWSTDYVTAPCFTCVLPPKNFLIHLCHKPLLGILETPMKHMSN